MNEETRDWGRLSFGLAAALVGLALTATPAGSYGVIGIAVGVPFALTAAWRLFDARRSRRSTSE